MELMEGGAGSPVCVCVGGVIEGMSMELMEGGAGSPVCVCGGGVLLRACPWNSWKVGLVVCVWGVLLRACPWNPWKVGLVVLCVCVGGVIEGMSMEPMEGGAGSPVCVCVCGGGGH